MGRGIAGQMYCEGGENQTGEREDGERNRLPHNGALSAPCQTHRRLSSNAGIIAIAFAKIFDQMTG